MSPTSSVHHVESFDCGCDQRGVRQRLPIAPLARRLYSNKAARWAAGFALGALCAGAFYRVRELLAALFLFSILFVVVMLGALIVWLVDEAAYRAAIRVESRIAHVAPRQITAPSDAHSKQGPENRPWH